MAVPYLDRVFTVVQSDGTSIRLRGNGGQHGAVFTLLDDDAAAPADFAAPATIAQSAATDPLNRGRMRWRQRRQERRASLAAAAAAAPELRALPPSRPTTGVFVGLALLIDFNEAPGTISPAQVEAFCNQPGYVGFGNSGSVRDYFLEAARGRVDYSNIVMPYHRAAKSRDYYTDRTVPWPQRAQELVAEALTALAANGFDFTRLSTDAGGNVYAINAFYAGPLVNRFREGLWAHQYNLAAPLALAAGIVANDYQVSPMEDELTLGTFCHENGHMLCDFPDLYDYNDVSYGAGAFCLMAFGGSGSAAKSPGQIGAYLKHAAGWADDVVPLGAPGSVSLDAGANVFAMLSRTPTEYYIAEHRQRGPRDRFLPGGGLALWRVDENGKNSQPQMTAASHYECALLQADGLSQLEAKASVGDAGDLFGPGTSFGRSAAPTSNWWNGTASGLILQNLSIAGTTLSFDVV